MAPIFLSCLPWIVLRTTIYNRKGWHSIVLQALVDHDYKFMNTYVGWPGSVHDARILSNSEVYAKGESGMFRYVMRT